MFSRTRVLAAGLLATALMGVAGCTSSDDSSSAGSADGGALEKVNYLTTFQNNGRDAFAFVAQEKGYFKEAGLEVNIQLGKATGENVKQVVAGTVDYSNVDMIGAWILESTTPEYKDQFKTIAAVHQQSLVAIFALEGGGINSPKDLEGKTIGAAANSVNQVLFPAYAKLAGVDPTKVKFQDVQTTQVAGLLGAGAVPAVSTFLISQGGIEAAAKGKKAVVLRYNDYLQDLYGNGIIASAKVLKENPDQARRMQEALMKGLQYTIDHPDEAVAILKKAQPSITEKAALGEINLMKPYVPAQNGAPIGSMDEAKVAKAIAILQGSGVLKEPLTPEGVVAFDVAPKVTAASSAAAN